MNKTVIIGVVGIVAVGIIAFRVGSTAASNAALGPIEVEGLTNAETLVDLADGVQYGEPDAPVTIVEFGDYQCPGCMGFNQGQKPQMDLSLIQSGEAKFIYYDLPLVSIHPWAFLAARAARCAGDQDMYWEYHDALFANQPRWSPASAPPIGDFEGYADDLGLDGGDFSACLNSDMHADVVTANLTLAAQLGVSSTPTIMVSLEGVPARRVANAGFLDIQAAIASLREEAAAMEGGN